MHLTAFAQEGIDLKVELAAKFGFGDRRLQQGIPNKRFDRLGYPKFAGFKKRRCDILSQSGGALALI